MVLLLEILAGCFLNAMMFHPQMPSYDEQSEGYVDIGTNGVRIAAIVYDHPHPSKVVIRCHGNAEDAAQTLWALQGLKDFGCTVASVDYPGYGLSSGAPDEKGCYRNVHRLYDWLVETKGIKPADIIVDGFSIGTGPAVELAATRPVGGLVLEAAYLSAPRIVTKVRLLPVDPFPNLKRIGEVKCPVIFFHGTDDEIIPYAHGQELYRLAPEPKRFVSVAAAGHNNLVDVYGCERYLETIRKTFAFSDWVTTSCEGDVRLGRHVNADKELETGDPDQLTTTGDVDEARSEIASLIREVVGDAPVEEGFVKLAKPFFGFPWLRIDGSGCSAEMTFESVGASDIPKARIESLEQYLIRERRLRVVRRVDNYLRYEVLAQSSGVKYRFYLESEVGKHGVWGKRYTLGFSLERILGPYESRRLPLTTEYWDWKDVVHETVVDRPQDEASWQYVIEPGRSSEELLDAYIAGEDKGILKCGHTEIGMCIGSGTNEYTACTEAEATRYLPFSGCYVRPVSRERQKFLYQKLIHPECFRPGRTVPVYCQIGSIFWKVIPGDTIEWFEPEKRHRVGTVVRDDEEGVYWEPIKAKVKVTVDDELATKEDWRPTAQTEVYWEKKGKLINGHRIFRSHDDPKDEGRLIEFLTSCKDEMKPGVYGAPYTGGITDFRPQTKAIVREKVLARERRAYNDWQYELNRAREEALDDYFGTHVNYGIGCRPDAAMERRLGLTRKECYQLRALPGWRALAYTLSHHRWLRTEVRTGVRTLDEPRLLPQGKDFDSLVAELEAIAAAKPNPREFFWIESRLLTVCQALEAVLESPVSDEGIRLEQAATKALLAEPSPEGIGEICSRLCLEYGEDPRSWRILSTLRDSAQKRLAEMLDVMFASRWHAYCMGTSSEIAVPVGWPFDCAAVWYEQQETERRSAVALPDGSKTNAYAYVYWSEKQRRAHVAIYARDAHAGFSVAFDSQQSWQAEGRVFLAIGDEDDATAPGFWIRWLDVLTDEEFIKHYRLDGHCVNEL